MSEDFEYFNEVVQRLREPAIEGSTRLLEPGAKGPTAERWRQAVDQSPAHGIREVVPDVVDELLFR